MNIKNIFSLGKDASKENQKKLYSYIFLGVIVGALFLSLGFLTGAGIKGFFYGFVICCGISLGIIGLFLGINFQVSKKKSIPWCTQGKVCVIFISMAVLFLFSGFILSHTSIEAEGMRTYLFYFEK